MTSPKDQFISNKIKRINAEGVRKNTHARVSSHNQRRPVSRKQAIAVAISEAAKKYKT